MLVPVERLAGIMPAVSSSQCPHEVTDSTDNVCEKQEYGRDVSHSNITVSDTPV